MFITHKGVLYDEDNFGNEPLGNFRTVVTTKCTLTLNSVARLEGLNVDVQTECQLDLRVISELGDLNCHVTTNPRLESYVLRGTPGTLKSSSYTILPEISTHTEIANDNLPTQFKDCPNINDLLSFPLQELDKAQTDVYDFQSKILNIEEAEGVNLDICGAIVGQTRITNNPDETYRPKVLSQVFINNNDGTIPKILTSLLIMFNLEANYTSVEEVQLKRTSFNTMELFVRDRETVDVYSSSEELENMVSAGSRMEICVLDRLSAPGRVFRASGYIGQPDSESATITKGLGSIYDDTIGGNCVGLYNYEIYYQVSGDNSNSGADMITTTKTIPVETFE